MGMCGCFKKLFNFVGKVLNSPIFCSWLTIGFLFFLLVATVDFATDVNVVIDIANKQEKYSDMLQGIASFFKLFDNHLFCFQTPKKEKQNKTFVDENLLFG